MSEEWNGKERRERTRWSIDSWSALQSAATLLMMAVAGLVWGLKLESRIDMIGSQYRSEISQLQAKTVSLEAIISKGILPIAEVRMNTLESRVDTVTKELNDCIKKR